MDFLQLNLWRQSCADLSNAALFPLYKNRKCKHTQQFPVPDSDSRNPWLSQIHSAWGQKVNLVRDSLCKMVTGENDWIAQRGGIFCLSKTDHRFLLIIHKFPHHTHDESLSQFSPFKYFPPSEQKSDHLTPKFGNERKCSRVKGF